MKKFDVAILAGHLVTMKEDQGGVLEEAQRNGLIGINGSTIDYVGPASIEYSAKETVDAKDKIVLPAFVNAHCHLPMTLFRGLADDLPFKTWLFDYILPLERRLVSPEFVRIGTELAAVELIRGGTATVADMYFFENDIADVWRQAGLRGFLGESITDFDAPDDKDKDGQPYRILEKMLGEYENSELITVAIAPHAPYSCSNQTLEEVLRRATDWKIPITTHVSETKAEVDDHIKQYGKSPLKRLADMGFLEHRCAMAHCVHFTQEDIDLVKGTSASIVHNPESNLKLGSGIAPVREFLDKGLTVSLGTDGAASNNNLNMFVEMDMAAKLQKMRSQTSTGMTAMEALRMATKGGAESLGLSQVCGSLEVGKRADINIVGTSYAHMRPVHSAFSALVYSATGGEVESLMCHGKWLMKDKKLLTIDENEIYAKVDKYRERENF